jgi:hypothetical protein
MVSNRCSLTSHERKIQPKDPRWLWDDTELHPEVAGKELEPEQVRLLRDMDKDPELEEAVTKPAMCRHLAKRLLARDSVAKWLEPAITAAGKEGIGLAERA